MIVFSTSVELQVRDVSSQRQLSLKPELLDGWLVGWLVDSQRQLSSKPEFSTSVELKPGIVSSQRQLSSTV